MSASQQSEVALNQHLVAWLRAELPAQKQRLDNLRALRASMAHQDPSVCEALLETVQAEERSAHTREARVRTLLGRFADLWQVEAEDCQVSTVAERLPSEASLLLSLRGELRDVMQELALEGQRVMATARVHRGLILEVLNEIFDPTPGDPMEEQGHLLDAEA